MPKVLILQNVESSELLRVDALQTEDLDGRARETTLRRLGRALHEQHDGRGGDGLVDGGAHFGRQEGLLKGGEARREERVAARAEGLGGDLWWVLVDDGRELIDRMINGEGRAADREGGSGEHVCGDL